MKHVTKLEVMRMILSFDELSPTEAHVAMSIFLGHTYQEIKGMYKSSTASTINCLSHKQVIKQVFHGVWELNRNRNEWRAWNKNAPTKTPALSLVKADTEKEATLEMMAQLEKQLNELKKKVG